MPILYKYIAKEIFALFVAIILVLLGIILSFRLVRLLSAAVAGDMSLASLWKLIGLQALNMMIILMPVALILAAVMTLGRLYRDQEMAAAFACGVGLPTVQKIILVPTIPIAAAILSLTLIYLPDIYAQSSLLRSQARQEAGIALLSAESFRRVDNSTTVHTGENTDNGGYANFFIAQNNPQNSSAVFAQMGRISQNGKNHFLDLSEGIRVEWDKDLNPKTASYTEFDKASLHLPTTEAKTDEKLRNIPTKKLNNSVAHRAELQNRLNAALAVIIFSFAIPLIAHTPPRKRSQKMLPAFLLFALYINLLDLTVKAVAKGKIPVNIGCYALHLTVFVIILLFWLRTRRVRS